MNCVNLIPSRRREAQARKARVLKWTMGLVAYGIALLIGYLLCSRQTGSDCMELNRQSRKVAIESNANSRIFHALDEELAETQRKLFTAQAIGRQPDWSVLLDLVARNLGDDLVLDLCHLQRLPHAEKTVNAQGSGASSPGATPGEQLLLELSGFAKAQSHVSTYMLRLEKTGLFDRVKLVKTNRTPFMSGKAVAFDLECTFQGSGGTTQ